MQIEAISIHQINLPLLSPFTTSFGTMTTREIVLVQMHCEGITGWGEAPALSEPLYNEETTGTVWHMLKDILTPRVVGRDFAHPAALAAALAPIRRNRLARSALEAAFWDAWSRSRREPLWRALGGVKREIPVGVSVGIHPDPASLVHTVGGYLAEGYRRIKLKIRPGNDAEPVRAVRAAYGSIPLMVDANSAYRLDDAEHLRRLDDFDLMMIEQPLAEDDLLEHAQLQALLRTPICLDESIETPVDARWALKLASCRVINVKVPRVGGLCAALAIHEIAGAANVPLWCGGMMETGVGRALNLAIASLPGFTLPGDTSASDRYFAEDLVEPSAVLQPDGTIWLSDAPGRGCAVLPERVARFRQRLWEAR